LLGNAFKFTRQGEIILEVREVGELDNHKVLIRISVKDTGVGISEDVQKSLFSPFTQADSSTTRKYGGTGLGLSICKQLTDLMQGSIGVISEVGKGSEFWVELPFKLTA
jgi:signal transduction histidine kinase